VRINGKPRHEFVLGLGSQKDKGRRVMELWTAAVARMRRHGIPEEEQRRILAEMVRKGARPPTLADCQDYGRNWGRWPRMAESAASVADLMNLGTMNV
jgi:hypothetical protein